MAAGNSLQDEGKEQSTSGPRGTLFGPPPDAGELPTPPAQVIEFNAVLSATPIDLKRLAGVLDSAPNLAAQVIKLSNSSLFNLPNPVSSLEQAVVMLGTDYLRALLLTHALIETVGDYVAPREQYCFWERGFLTASVSEGLARRTQYPEVEMAYFGGLLHDIGTLPFLAAPPELKVHWKESWESPHLEQQLFGGDHSELGRRIGILWNFPQPLLEVFEFHHEPQKACHHRTLVAIVAIAEQFCRTQHAGPDEAQPSLGLPQHGGGQDLWSAVVSDSEPTVQRVLAQGMEADFRRMSEWLKAGFNELFFPANAVPK